MSTNELSKAPSKEQEAIEERDEELQGAAGMSPEERAKMERRLLWKLDARFLLLVILYILNYIDRSALSSARTKGFEEDLGITDQQMDTLLSILYVGYISLQIPSNMLIQYTGRPSIFIPACVFVWGGISTSTGAVKSFGPALVVRLLLGVAECSFFPGSLLLLASWYKKNELGKRITLLYCGSLVSNAFGPLIAAGILGTMEGKGGVRAWQWLFYIEGALTMFFAIIAALVLPDFPHNSRHFSKAELELAQLRMTEDVGTKDDTKVSNWTAFKFAMGDYKLWTMVFALTSMVISLSFNQFFPQLTKTLGYDNTASLLLCAPPFVFAAIVAFFVSRDSDKRQERYLHIVTPLCFGLVGFIIAMTTHSFAPRYISLFLMAGSYAGFVVFYAWVAFDHNAINPAACAISCYFYPPFVTLFQLLANFATTAAPGPVAEEVHSFAEALQAHIVDETIVNELAWLHGQDALEGLEREEDLERRRSLEHLLDELSRRSQREALPRDVSARASSSTPPPSPSLRSPPSSSPPRAQQPQTPTFSSPPPASSSSNSASGTARSSCLFGSEPDPPSTDFTLPDDQAPPSSKRPALSSSTEGTLPAGTTEKAPPKLRAVLGDITNSKAPVSDVASTSVAPDKSPPAAAFAGQSRDLGSTLPPPSSPGVPVATQTDGPHGSEANDDAPERAVSENGGADQDWAPSISGSQAESESGSESEDDQADLLADLMKLGDTDQSSHRPTTQALVGNIADRLTLTLRARLPIITLLVRQIFSEFSNPDQNSVPALFRDRSPLSLEQYLALAPEPANPLVVDPLYLVVHIKLDGILRQDDQQSQLWTDAIATLCSVWNAHLDGPVPVVSRSHLVNTAAVTASMRRSSSDPDEDLDEEDADSEDAFVPIPSKRRRVAGIRARARTRPRAVET